jgi:hypothetical protein
VVAIGMTCAPVDLGVGSPAGVVVDQAPAANAGADPKQPVTVRFYGTAPVAVPSIVGAGPAAACGALQSAGLVCAPSDSEVTRDVNVVHSQSIAPGTAVRPGTAVGYTYQDTAPVTLHRYKAPAPGRANFIGTGGGPAGWSTQSDLGGVYGTGGGVPGLVPVYEFCWSACGAGTATYYFSANPNPSAGYVVAGAAFSCFNPGAAQPPGTRPLHAWFNGTVWVWAVPGSGEAATFAGAGFTDRFLVCFIW